jgi:hypothetical protein
MDHSAMPAIVYNKLGVTTNWKILCAAEVPVETRPASSVGIFRVPPQRYRRAILCRICRTHYHDSHKSKTMHVFSSRTTTR